MIFQMLSSSYYNINDTGIMSTKIIEYTNIYLQPLQCFYIHMKVCTQHLFAKGEGKNKLNQDHKEHNYPVQLLCS